MSDFRNKKAGAAAVDPDKYNAVIDGLLTASGVPAGGTTGQVLTKASNADGDADWEAATGGPVLIPAGPISAQLVLIPVGSTPNLLAASPDGTKLYVPNGDTTVSVIDVATNTVVATMTVPTGAAAAAFTPSGAKAYITSGVPTDGLTPIVVATNTPGTPFGGSAFSYPSAVAVSPDGTKAYVLSQNDHTFTPITVADDTVGAPVSVGSAPNQIAFTPDGTKAYVTDYSDGTVTPIDVATDTPGDPIMINDGDTIYSIAVAPDGVTAYCTDTTSGEVVPIDVATDTPGTPITVDAGPEGIAITADGKTAYVSCVVDPGSIVPITLETATPGTSIVSGSGSSDPTGIVATPDNHIYVTNLGDGTVALLVQPVYGLPS